MKWSAFSKAAILELAAVLQKAGVEITPVEASTKEELVKTLDQLGITPSAALQLQFRAGYTPMDFGQGPKAELPKIQPQAKGEKIDEFLRRFKAWATVMDIPKGAWMKHLWGALSPEAGATLGAMPTKDLREFEKVEVFLKSQYQITPEEQLRRFRAEKMKCNETFTQFASRMKEYLKGFLKITETEFEDGSKLVVPMLCEQLLSCTGDELQCQVRRRLAGDWTNLKIIVEAFETEHEILRGRKQQGHNQSKEKVAENQRQKQPFRDSQRPSQHSCFNCNEVGHLAFNCPKKNKPENSQEGH